MVYSVRNKFIGTKECFGLKGFDCKKSNISAILGSFLRRVKVQESADNRPFLTLIGAGGLNPFFCWEIGCHFLQKPSGVLKILGFFKNDVGPRVEESFWAYLQWLSKKWALMWFDGPRSFLAIFWHLMWFSGPKNLMWFDGPISNFSPFKISCGIMDPLGPLYHMRLLWFWGKNKVHCFTSDSRSIKTHQLFGTTKPHEILNGENPSEFRSTKPHLFHMGPSNHISFCGTNVVSWTLWAHYFTWDLGST